MESRNIQPQNRHTWSFSHTTSTDVYVVAQQLLMVVKLHDSSRWSDQFPILAARVLAAKSDFYSPPYNWDLFHCWALDIYLYGPNIHRMWSQFEMLTYNAKMYFQHEILTTISKKVLYLSHLQLLNCWTAGRCNIPLENVEFGIIYSVWDGSVMLALRPTTLHRSDKCRWRCWGNVWTLHGLWH